MSKNKQRKSDCVENKKAGRQDRKVGPFSKEQLYFSLKI